MTNDVDSAKIAPRPPAESQVSVGPNRRGEYEVSDGRRTYAFDGYHLAHVSSQRSLSPRWVEFDIYRTTGGRYVVSRKGASLLFHTLACDVVKRNNPILGQPGPDRVPCDVCRPNPDEDTIVLEINREWATITPGADGVVEALARYDDAGARYLTNVARRALEMASKYDSAIRAAYEVEFLY